MVAFMAGYCNHCKGTRFKHLYARGLCRRCYDDLRVRESYPLAPRKRPCDWDQHCNYRPGEADYPPTEFRPGTEGKVRVLTERFAKGLPLFHPQDAGYDGRPMSEGWSVEAMLKTIYRGEE